MGKRLRYDNYGWSLLILYDLLTILVDGDAQVVQLSRSMTSHVLLILKLSGLAETSTTTDFQSSLVQTRA